ICTPINMHTEIAVAAAAAGTMVLCEKPLSSTLEEGGKMAAAAEANQANNTVRQNYRRLAAVTLDKQIADSGKPGKILQYRSNFLQDWTINENLPQGGAAFWRMDADAAGSGVTGDLLAHCIDLAMWINGGIKDVSAMTEIFVKQRMHEETGKMEDVKI